MKFQKYIQVLVFVFGLGQLCAQSDFTINNVTVFDGENILEPTNVSVKNGKIDAIGREVAGDSIIDGTGKFLMPGLTNSHVHAFMPGALQEAARAGVLNLLDMHGLEAFQGNMKELGRDSQNANYYYAGYAATAPGGHGTQYGFPVPTLQKPEDAKKWVQDRVDAGVDYIKIIVEPWKATLDPATVAAIVEETHNLDKKAVVHVSKKKDALMAIAAGADGLVHIWSDAPMTQGEFARFTQNKDFFVIPTILVNYAVQEAYFNKTAEEANTVLRWIKKEVKRLYDAGVPILAGTDPPNANINMGTDLYKELVYFSKTGIPNLDVLKSATSIPAEKFGLENKGFIRAGYDADMLLLDKSPIEDIEHIAAIYMIWKGGVVVISVQ